MPKPLLLPLWALIFVTGFTQTYPVWAKASRFAAVSIPDYTAPVPYAKPRVNEAVLADPLGRISPEFRVSSGMMARTDFWLKVYTRWGNQDYIIHHNLYPWIVYDVVNTAEIEGSTHLHRWTRYHKAKKLVERRRNEIQATLNRLAKRKSLKNLSASEERILSTLANIPGPKKQILRTATQNLRVQLGQKDYFKNGLRSSSKYLPFMEAEFRATGLPIELTRLPFVESSFNERAESKVGASGIWQIMPRTGRQYLIVSDHIDERNSPLKASLAAIQILRSNYRVLGSWPLALTAYNHGPSGVKKALRRARADNLEDLIARYHRGSFKFASANFYSCFLAALHAERYHREIFATEGYEELPIMDHAVLTLVAPTKVRSVIRELGISKDLLLTYNLDLRKGIAKNALLPRGYRLLVPPAYKSFVLAQDPQRGKSRRLFVEASADLPARPTKKSG